MDVGQQRKRTPSGRDYDMPPVVLAFGFAYLQPLGSLPDRAIGRGPFVRFRKRPTLHVDDRRYGESTKRVYISKRSHRLATRSRPTDAA